MADPSQSHSAPSRRWWIRLCQWLWRRFVFLWTAVVLTLVLGIVTTWLTTKGFDISGTPLEWIPDHLPLVLACGCLFLVLTVVVRYLGRPVASPAPVLPTPQNRRAFIHQLRHEYRKQMSESLQSTAMMTLALQTHTDVVISSASLVSWHMDAPDESSFPALTSIVQAYDDAGAGLLLLGAPGAGKSTLLCELASELIIRAEHNAAQPMPVIVNLSSWALKKPPFTAWLVDQLQLMYAIPRHLGRVWIEQNQLLLLLDGLDEVELSARTDCVKAINAYRTEHFIPVVVCSRSQEYLEQEERLRLSVAVEVQPLTALQVNSYLKGAGKSMAAVRAALRSNTTLRDLIKTPLMLSIVMLTYRGKTANDLPQPGSAEDQQRQVFEHYVTRMLEQQARKWRYTPHKSCQWLIWLAQRMKQYGLTEFYVEQLQPAWLPTKRAQIVHFVLVGLLVGVVSGLFVGVVFGLVGGLFIGLVSGLLVGLVSGLFAGLSGEQPTVPFIEPSLPWKLYLKEQVVGLFIELSKREINLSEKLSFSWKLFLKGLVNGLQFGLLIGLLIGLVVGVVGGVVSGVFVGLLIGLVGGVFVGLLVGVLEGLSSTQVDEHIRLRPNQGIQTSGRNALRVGVVGGLVSGLVVGLFFGLVGGPLHGLFFGLVGGVSFGLFFGLVGGVSFGLFVGGKAYLQHYCLRYLLWRSGAMPWHYVRFLEEATERILLQRVGGGYRFIHPLFLDYFASLATPAPSHSAEKSSSQQP